MSIDWVAKIRETMDEIEIMEVDWKEAWERLERGEVNSSREIGYLFPKAINCNLRLSMYSAHLLLELKEEVDSLKK